MLKTHKDHFETFKKIQQCNSLEKLIEILQISVDDRVCQDNALHFNGKYYKMNKELVLPLSEDELKAINEIKDRPVKALKRSTPEETKVI